MSGMKLDKFDAGIMLKGVNVKAPAISSAMTLHEDTRNLSMGIHDGIGPRFGVSPIPGHSHTNAPELVTMTAGLMRSEETAGQAFTYRFNVYGVHAVTLGTYNLLQEKKTCYFWIVDRAASGGGSEHVVSGVVGSGGSSGVWNYTADIASGLPPALVTGSTNFTATERAFALWPLLVSATGDTVAAHCTMLSGRYHLPSAVFTVANPDVPNHWIAGQKVAVGDASKPMTANFDHKNAKAKGIPSAINTQLFKDSYRTIEFFDLDAGNALSRGYRYHNVTTPGTSIYIKNFYSSASVANTTFATLGNATETVARLDAAVPTYANNTLQLLHDEDMYTNASYTAVCAILDARPMIWLLHDWQRGSNGFPIAYAKPTGNAQFPVSRRTLTAGGTNYLIDGQPEATSFASWPSYTSGTPLPLHSATAMAGSVHITRDAVDTGILRANTEYELAFSIYDKQYNFETNVGTPVRFMTENDDFVRISIFRDITDTTAVGGTLLQHTPNSVFITNGIIPTTLNSINQPFWNYLEIRFYYRERGSFEWLPALFIDAAKYWYYPHGILWACEGAIAALPGGQPGGVNDYSNLPQENFIDVTVFQERMFWCGTKSLYWSYRKNVFAYAGRNSAACPSGEFRGTKVHVNAGERENTSRLIICATEGLYVGRFTGIFQQQPVQVSPETVESYDMEGSDFVVDFWTSYSAFSSRSMVVGEGTLYWWGPQGCFEDTGVGIPARISTALEPDIFGLFAPNATESIFALYFDQTQEVIWFYQPKGGDGTTTGLIIYNRRTQLWLLGEMDGVVDAGMPLTIEKSDTGAPTAVGGRRVVIFSREQNTSSYVQRAYFFDGKNRAGDISPTRELMVKQVSTPSTGTRRLTLAPGYNAAQLATVAAGDLVTLHQAQAYAGESSLATGLTFDDFIGKVSAVSTGSGYIDVLIPDEVTLDSINFGTSSQHSRFYIPLWHRAKAAVGINGFRWTKKNNYWAPGGLNREYLWLWLHLLWKVSLLPSLARLTYTVTHRTPIAGGAQTQTLRFRDNCDGHDQVYLPLTLGQQALQGQALQVTVSGIQIGSELVLQYLGAHGAPTDPDFLKQFHPEGP
jgi:hypothetical protein